MADGGGYTSTTESTVSSRLDAGDRISGGVTINYGLSKNDLLMYGGAAIAVGVVGFIIFGKSKKNKARGG